MSQNRGMMNHSRADNESPQNHRPQENPKRALADKLSCRSVLKCEGYGCTRPAQQLMTSLPLTASQGAIMWNSSNEDKCINNSKIEDEADLRKGHD